MRIHKKDLLSKAVRFVNPLRKLAMDGLLKRNPIVAPPKESKPKPRVTTGPKPAWLGTTLPIAKGPRLVTDSNKVRKLVQGDYIAEVSFSRNSTPQLFHYLVVKKDSPEILEWGQAISVHAAVAKAKSALQRRSAADSEPGALVAAD